MSYSAEIQNHLDGQLDRHISMIEEAEGWMETMWSELTDYITPTDYEDRMIVDRVAESYHDNCPRYAGVRAFAEINQFRDWHNEIKKKRPQTTEEEAFEYFEYFDDIENYSEEKRQEWVDDAVEDLNA